MALRDGQVLAANDDVDESRDSVDVRQWERWGPASLRPVVVAISLTALVMWVLTHMSTMTTPAVISMATGSSIALASDEVSSSAAANSAGAPPSGTQSGISAGTISTGTTSSPTTSAVLQTVVVQILGEVHEPGLVTLPSGARVSDAIEAAGGLLSPRSSGGLNLARRVVDGEQIIVSHKVPTAMPVSGSTSSGSMLSGSMLSGFSPSGGFASGGTVDLNAADVAALDALPGVGPVMAARIISWRDQHGRFTTINQLREISGIGQRTFERLKPLVRI